MQISCPNTPAEVPQLTSLWEELTGFEKTSETDDLSEGDVSKLLFIDKTRLLDALAVMQASIAYRAVRACVPYFDWMKKRSGTDKKTYLRPRVRIDSRHQTVEMSWMRRLSRSHLAKPGETPSKSRSGRSFQIKTDKGLLMVFAWNSYLKKGTKDRYSNQIFKDEPAWVQKLGSELEDKFEALRKEQKALTAVKRLVQNIDQLQLRQMSESAQEELSAWSRRDLCALYAPEIVLSSSAENPEETNEE